MTTFYQDLTAPATLEGPYPANGRLVKGGEEPPYYQFDDMAAEPGLIHGVFTRLDGESRPPFHSLNTSGSGGDQQRAVTANRHRIAAGLGLERLVFCDQVHGDDILIFSRRDRLAWQDLIDHPKPGDAMITDMPAVGLAIQVADCQAVILYDPGKAVVANIHAGWRGSVVNIAGKTVAAMTASFGCDPGELLAAVGPSLGPCCAEFVNFREELPGRFLAYREPNDHFDFWRITRDQLRQAGLNEKKISVAGICTRCHPNIFFSYRAEQITGRFAVVAALRNGPK